MKAWLWLSTLCCGALAQGFTPPGPGEEGGYYRDSADIAQLLFAAPTVELHTPGAVHERWSTVEEVYSMLEQFAAARPGLSVREIGESQTGAAIKALFHEVDRTDALTVLIQARVHGNEPASTEGALELAHALAIGELAELDINVIIVPVLNPEGARTMRRRTDGDIDPNRDYSLQNSSEVRTVYRLLAKYDPEVVLDMHEHASYAWPYDLMAIGPNNPNIPAPVIDFSNEVMMGGIAKAFDAQGLRMGPYRLLDFPEGQVRVRESATTFVSAKNALALAGRISLLTEGRGIRLGEQHFHRRTLAQYTAARAVVESAAKHEARIQDLLSGARRSIANDTREWILRVDPVQVKSEHALLNADSAQAEIVTSTYWERTKGTIAERLPVPAGYLIPADQEALMDRLRRFGLEATEVTESAEFAVETLTVERFEAGAESLYGGQLERADGALVLPPVLRNHEISVSVQRELKRVPGGSWIIPTNQINALYLMSLEPGVTSGFAACGFWGDDLAAGFEFPVYRLVELPGSMQ